ncbi:hypothetical protein [Aquimarina latercula]|uniref:hypothetical protein n=1 Tax=Aquimarina latercula TaxID=987 RepID=UPI00041DF6DE|nr:hypothetical protein [Aquimarina latercula]
MKNYIITISFLASVLIINSCRFNPDVEFKSCVYNDLPVKLYYDTEDSTESVLIIPHKLKITNHSRKPIAFGAIYYSTLGYHDNVLYKLSEGDLNRMSQTRNDTIILDRNSISEFVHYSHMKVYRENDVSSFWNKYKMRKEKDSDTLVLANYVDFKRQYPDIIDFIQKYNKTIDVLICDPNVLEPSSCKLVKTNIKYE